LPAFFEGTINKKYLENTDSEMVNPKDTDVDRLYSSENYYENEFTEVGNTFLNNDCSENSLGVKYKRLPRKSVQLSTKEISTSLLDSVPVPVRSPLNYVRRDSLKYACRRIVGMSTLKMKKNKTRSISDQNKHPVVFGKKLEAKRVDACNIGDHLHNFRYKKQTKTLVNDKSISLPVRREVNRIPVKMADTSPRYTAPDNIVVDFESLRIAAHLQRLKTNSSSSQTEVAIKLLKSTKTYDMKMPCVDKNGFKTVVSGFAT
jgi:hypothetical protein